MQAVRGPSRSTLNIRPAKMKNVHGFRASIKRVRLSSLIDETHLALQRNSSFFPKTISKNHHYPVQGRSLSAMINGNTVMILMIVSNVAVNL